MAPSLRSLLLAAAALTLQAGCGLAQPPPSSTEVDPGGSATTGTWQVLSSNVGAFTGVNSSYTVRKCACASLHTSLLTRSAR